MIFINCGSGVLTAKGVLRCRCKQLPVIVAVIPVLEIASSEVFISPRIPAAVTASSALEEVAAGRTAAILAELFIVTCDLISTVPEPPFSVV